MRFSKTLLKLQRSRIWLISLLLLTLIVSGLSASAYAQEEGAVQVIRGRATSDGITVYRLNDLQTLQRLTVYVESTSGNFDPFVALLPVDADPTSLVEDFWAQIDEAIASGKDPVEVIADFSNQAFIAWDDDSGKGYDAAFEYVIPYAGDYRLAVFDSPQQPSFGNYRLILGIDAPGLLKGEARATGDVIATLDTSLTTPNVAVSSASGTLGPKKQKAIHGLQDIKAGDTLYVFVEATEGDLKPTIILEDYGEKMLALANVAGTEAQATLTYTYNEDALNNRIRIVSKEEDGAIPEGSYRLLVGINEPSVLSGQAVVTSRPAIKDPLNVKVGVQMDQITGVDQKAENFGVAATIRMEWDDPRLAFNPDDCDCRFQQYSLSEFTKYIGSNNLSWPEYYFFNQQGRRDSQSPTVAVQPDGHAILFERFSATFQAPDFDFRLFPFDTQEFYIRSRSVLPADLVQYSELERFSGPGQQLGEEEWIMKKWWTEIETADGSPQFSFAFTANRHLTYYIFRIFIPVLVIIIVSWFTFFLKDYAKRVDVASGNLLLFMAFNWTIANDLPRLGYLTLLDAILVSTFVITGLVVVFNVWLKRLQDKKKESIAYTIDKYSIWLYPILYFATFAIVIYLFVSPGGAN